MSPTSAAGACVSPHLRVLHYCGYCQLSVTSPRWACVAHRAYCMFALAACSLYLGQECVYAYQVCGDLEKLSRVMFLLLCHVTSLAKQIVFHTDVDRINVLVDRLNDPLFNALESHDALAVTARRARLLLRCYSGCAVVTCVLWLVWPVTRLLLVQSVEFPFWLPAAPDSTAQSALVLLYSHYITTLVGIANTTMDAFIGTVLYQCTTQLNILQLNLANLAVRSRQIAKTTEEDFEPTLMKCFYECLRHYNKINEITNSLLDIFGTAIMIQFAIGGWILCMAAYKMVNLSVLSVEFASMTLFILCILTELFLYCFFGNELTYESARVSGALYACGWERGRTRRFLRGLLLAGERARRPLRAVAASLVPLSLETFLKILKSSYTCYTVLRQTKRNDS